MSEETDRFRPKIIKAYGVEVGIGIYDTLKQGWVGLPVPEGGRRYITLNPHKAEFHAKLLNEAGAQGRPGPRLV